MLFKSILLTVTLATMCGTALASDAPAEMSAPTVAEGPQHDWTGFYAGIVAGGLSNSTTRSVLLGDEEYDGAVYSGIYELDGRSGSIGGTIGYNYQSGNIVFGLEADYSISNNSGLIDGLNWDYGLGSVGYNLDGFGTVRARAGIAVDRMMLYVTGGLAFGKYTASQTDDYNSDNEYSVDTVRIGITAGVGAEVAVTENISLKGELLAYDLGTDNYDYDYGVYSDSASGVIARVGLNFSF